MNSFCSQETKPARPSDPQNRQQQYQERLAGQMAKHKEALAELETIKKIAEEEGAPRTVEAIQKMIDTKDNEFKQKLEQFERQRTTRLEQLQQRLTERRARRNPVATESKETENK